MKTLDELKAYLQIDKSNLDEEIIRQPSLFYTISEYYASTVAVKDTAKENLARIDAELMPVVTVKIEKSGARATDAKTISALTQEKKHIKAFDEYVTAKVEHEKASALKDAFQMRGYMLRDLVGLFVANYFEKDSVTKRTSDEKDIIHKRNRSRINEKRLKSKGK